MAKHRLLKTALLTSGIGYIGASYYIFRNSFDLFHSTYLKGFKRAHSSEDEKAEQWFEKQKREDVFITSFDGLKLHAIRIETNPKSNNWMLCVHGYQSRGAEMKGYLYQFKGEMPNFLVIDQRGRGLSEGQYTGMGWLEHYDVKDWINHLVSYRPDAKIVLFGVSLGAATVMNTLGQNLPENVVACVEDCGFSSIKEILSYTLQGQMGFSMDAFLRGVDFYVQQYCGFSFLSVSTREQLMKAKVPVLFIHGDQDSIVPASMAYDNYYACASDKQLSIFEGYKHAACHNDGTYVNTIFTFLKQHTEM